MKKEKKKILITDDAEINRSILSDMLKDEFEIVEAKNGLEAVNILKESRNQIDLVLLDIVMPEMDGFEVLAIMNKHNLIQDIPVIMITAENSPSYVERAYDLGVTDFISRPFDSHIVHRRVLNTIMLYSKQKKLVDLVSDQIYAKEKQSNLMIEILSNIVEFRNGESGLHVLHINVLTQLLLNQLMSKTDKYKLTTQDVNLISCASALHDIGKIAISEQILNKKGKLTAEEFEEMKKHSEVGAAMLKNLPFRQNEPLVKVAYDICRHHHERYDGKGYPDGLLGDQIPIAAQVVSLADVYDALVSVRVYKDAYTHEEALQMILRGECGQFNPILIECLKDISDIIPNELKVNSLSDFSKSQVRNIKSEMVQYQELSASERTLRLLEHERTKYNFFASMSHEVQFEYSLYPPQITLSESGAKQLGIPELIINPCENEYLTSLFKQQDLLDFQDALANTTPSKPIIHKEYEVSLNGSPIWFKIIARSMWSSDAIPQYIGAIGKLVDITEEKMRISQLEKKAHYDNLTGLLNHESIKDMICEKLKASAYGEFALIIVDIDNFKQINDTCGHLFGDEVLKTFSGKMKSMLNSNELVARVGGDEFLIFLSNNDNIRQRVEQIHKDLTIKQGDCPIFVSMGITLSEGKDSIYEKLFVKADQALYASKRTGRNTYRFYNNNMQDMFTSLSPIDNDRG